MFLTTAALVLSLTAPAQQGFVDGPVTSSGICHSLLDGSDTTQLYMTPSVQHNDAAQTPKAGDVFYAELTITAMAQPCAPVMTVRPAFKLPAGWTFVPPGTNNGPHTQCGISNNGDITSPNAFTVVPCPPTFTATASDGTLFFDKTNLMKWVLNDEQSLRIQIPVRASTPGPATFTGRADWHLFSSSSASFFQAVSSLNTSVFKRLPEVSAADPAVTEITAHTAHVFGYVDPHFNAGTVKLLVGKVGQSNLDIVDSAHLDNSLDTADVDSEVDFLDADTDYKFQWSYSMDAGITVSGPVQTFRTAPRAEFPYIESVSAGGIVTKSLLATNGSYTEGDSVTFTALANPDSHLVSFVVNGVELAPQTSTTVLVSGPVTVSVAFDLNDTGDNNSGSNGNFGGAPNTGDNSGSAGNGTDDNGNNDNTSVRGQIRFSNTNGGASNDDADGGCASTKAGSAPMLAVLVVFIARRRRR